MGFLRAASKAESLVAATPAEGISSAAEQVQDAIDAVVGRRPASKADRGKADKTTKASSSSIHTDSPCYSRGPAEPSVEDEQNEYRKLAFGDGYRLGRVSGRVPRHDQAGASQGRQLSEHSAANIWPAIRTSAKRKHDTYWHAAHRNAPNSGMRNAPYSGRNAPYKWPDVGAVPRGTERQHEKSAAVGATYRPRPCPLKPRAPPIGGYIRRPSKYSSRPDSRFAAGESRTVDCDHRSQWSAPPRLRRQGPARRRSACSGCSCR